MQMAMSILTSQSDKLLKLTVGMGFFMMLCSMLAIIAIVVQYFVTNVNPGWSSIIATICMMSGMIIVCIGVVGIYVGNIFMQSKERPLYVVRTVLNNKQVEK